MRGNNPIQLSDHYTYRRLLKFTAPTILMMLCSSVYGIVDGLFIANYVGKRAFAAVNLIWPFPMLLGAVGYMFGSGGCALVSKTLGEGDEKKARVFFSFLTVTAFSIGAILAIIGMILLKDAAILLGATGNILGMSLQYGKYITAALPFFIMQCMFQPYMIAAEKPWRGFWIIFAAGVVNVFFDWLFIVELQMGVKGSGIATLLSQIVGAVLPFLMFVIYKPRNLFFGRIAAEWKVLRKACINGISEFVVNAAMPLVNLLYVYELLHNVGEDGVGAYGVIMYVNVLFFGIYNGFSMGSAPIVSYHYGACNTTEVKNVRKITTRLLLLSAIAVVVLAELFASQIGRAFSGLDSDFAEMISLSFSIYATSFLFAPINIYASTFFTALNNGKVSCIISFARIFLFQSGAVLLLPLTVGSNGYWWALPVAEFLCLFVTAYCYWKNKSKYNY